LRGISVELDGFLFGLRGHGDVRQPGTLIFRLGGYDARALDMEVVQERYEAAMADGRLQPGDFWRGEDQPFIHLLCSGGANAQHIFGGDSSTSATQTATNLEGRRAVLRLLRFVRSLPGCEDAQLETLCTTATARETYRIVGEKTITYEDYMAGRIYEDAVCYSLYFIDVHTEHGVEHEFVAPDRAPHSHTTGTLARKTNPFKEILNDRLPLPLDLLQYLGLGLIRVPDQDNADRKKHDQPRDHPKAPHVRKRLQ
jgi:hypothetical protein